MRILKAVKSAFEAIGIFFLIMFGCYYFDHSEGFEVMDYLLSGGIAIFLVWMENKSFRWMADHFEVDECPYCGATLEWEEVENK